MRLIEYPSYTQNKAQNILALAIIAGIILCLLSIFVAHILLAAVPFLMLYALLEGGDALSAGYSTWVRGYQGEKQVKMLLSALPDTFTLVTAFAAPNSKQGDTDAVLIGPHGVLVMEVKTYAGCIEFESGKWYRRTSNNYRIALRANPSAQAKRNEASVARFVGQQLGVTPSAAQFPVPCYCSVVFCETQQLNTPGLQAVHAVLAKDILRLVASLQPTLNTQQVSTLSLVFLEASRSANSALKQRKAARTV